MCVTVGGAAVPVGRGAGETSVAVAISTDSFSTMHESSWSQAVFALGSLQIESLQHQQNGKGILNE